MVCALGQPYSQYPGAIQFRTELDRVSRSDEYHLSVIGVRTFVPETDSSNEAGSRAWLLQKKRAIVRVLSVEYAALSTYSPRRTALIVGQRVAGGAGVVGKRARWNPSEFRHHIGLGLNTVRCPMTTSTWC